MLRPTISLLLLVAVTALPATAAAATSSDSSAVMAVVHQFIDGFNKGDTKSGLAACDATETDIIDEFPPHHWESCTAWMNAYAASAKAAGDTDGWVTLGKPWSLDVSGNVAYVVAPSTFAYKEKGKSVNETGSVFTLVLIKSAGGWHIRAWTWSKNKVS